MSRSEGLSTRSLETRSAAPLRASGFRWPREWTPYLFIAPLVVYLPAVFAYPLFYNALISFQNFTIRSVVTGAADFVGLDNFRAILSNPVTWLALRNTAIFAASSLFLQYVIGLALALLFTRAFPLKGFMRGIMLLPWLLPSVATVTVWLWLFDGTNGLINYFLLQLHVIAMPVSWLNSPASALVAIIIVNVWVGIPFNLVILYSGIQAIPKELYEAAEIDGARAFQRFRFVTLPLLKPVNAVLLLLFCHARSCRERAFLQAKSPPRKSFGFTRRRAPQYGGHAGDRTPHAPRHPQPALSRRDEPCRGRSESRRGDRPPARDR